MLNPLALVASSEAFLGTTLSTLLGKVGLGITALVAAYFIWEIVYAPFYAHGRLANAEEATRAQFISIVATLKVMNERYQDPDNNLQDLIAHLEQGEVRIFFGDDLQGAGNHHVLDKGDLFVDTEVEEHGLFAVALTVYAEFQHDLNAKRHYPDDTQDTQDAFARLRRNVLEKGEWNTYIENLHHGNTTNEL